MGNKIFTYEIGREYAARVENLRAYDVVSQDVIHRWTYPMVPDISFGGNTSGLRFERCNVYKAAGLSPTSSRVTLKTYLFMLSGVFAGFWSRLYLTLYGFVFKTRPVLIGIF